MKHTAEEVRDYADACRLAHKGPVIADMLTELVERIEADEAKALGACPKHGVEYVGECSGCAMTLPEKDFTHQPAQAAQVDAFADRLRQSIMRDTFQPTAEPVAQTAQVDWIAALRKELLHSKMTHNFTFTRDEVMQLIGDPFSQPRAVPDGWVLVPREPTKAMLAAYEHVRSGADWQENVFRLTKKQLARHKAAYMAMLEAAPQPGES